MRKILKAMLKLKAALIITSFPANPVVVEAFAIIEAYVKRLCPECEGQGKVRVWHAQDELGPPEECRKCKGTGRLI